MCLTTTSVATIPSVAVQAGKAITGILKPLEILTRPQLPRKPPASTAGQAQQPGAGNPNQAPAAPGSGSAAGGSSTEAGGAGSGAAHQPAPAAEVACLSMPYLMSLLQNPLLLCD